MASLQEILNNLKKEIFAQEPIIVDNMRLHFEDKPKYILFISISDGISRAHVCKGIGNSLDSSWKSALSVMNRITKDLQISPIWIKADIVKEIKEYEYNEFIDYVSHIKTNYFREGIAFDKMFNTAFLEQEVNANVFIDKNKDSEMKRMVWKNVNFYLRNNLGMKYSIDENSVERIYTFKTIGFFHDGFTCHRLNNEWLNNGRRHIENIDEELISSIIENSSDYLSRQIDESGKFRYGYFPCFNKEVPGYNILRHASTTYSMIEAYEITKDAKLGKAIKSALHYLVTEGTEVLAGIDGITRAFVVERVNDNEIKLGANAAAILALSKYTLVFNDDEYIQVMQQLAEGIIFFHNQDEGSFVHVLNFPDLSVKEKHRVIYYDGEAAFALMRLYGIDKNERWLNIVEQAFRYFIENSYWDYRDHWLSYCSNELVKYKPEREYIAFNLKNASGILDFCLTRETTYPTLLELLMATYSMISKMKEENLFLDLLNTFNERKLLRAIEHRVEHQLNGLYFPEVAMYYKVPVNILWAFYIRHHSFRSRIDDIEHNISGYCNYYHQILDNKLKEFHTEQKSKVNYFLNVNLGRHLTGIEHAAIKRMRLFKKMNQNVKIVTVTFNPELSKNIKAAGLDVNDVINMYDFYQDPLVETEKSCTLHDLLKLNPDFTYKAVDNTNDFKIYDKGQYVMYVHCFDLETMNIHYINYFDQDQRKIKREIFDIRGFKANKKILGENQVVLTESYFNAVGEVYIEKFYKMKNGKNELSAVLLNKRGGKYFFNNEKELITFFLEELVQNTGDNEDVIYYSDKNKIILPSLLEVSQPCRKIPVIHSVHVRDPQKIMDGDINGHYRLIFKNLNKFDACVVSTAEQKLDIEKRFSPQCQIYDIPAGFVQIADRKPMSERNNNRIICVARYFVEKRLDHIIEAVSKIRKEIPDVKLYLFGFGNAGDGYKVEKELRSLIKELDLEDSVFMMGYTEDIEKELDNAQLFILTSTIEGFCLALLEALSHGVPAISYDIKYGPSDMIHPGENGYLVLDGDSDELANKMLDFLSLDTTKQVFSDNAYKYSELFDEEAIINKWNAMLEEVC